MRELHTTITDPDALLALEPEELAGTILILLRDRIEREPRPISVHNCISEITSGASSVRGGQGYPPEAREEIALAVTEAFAWLEAQALLVPQPGSTGWSVLSRRARRFQSEEDFRQFQLARCLNRDLLHPAIAEEAWLSFVRGRFASAVFEAMRAVEIAVREAGGLAQKQVGTKLMQAAFGQGGPLRDSEADTAEEDGLMHLFIGAMGSYKNPHSHRNVAMEDAGEAIEIVTLASHLLRIVDARRPAQQEKPPDKV
ncbi:TIGR02391 family protein [Palleronia sp. LCG004]|uniref:TIGR02391 family protein n=1 Tax=Palleronia sp. LCG004 TaxID=3079304 RepID=UPI002942C41C|nr:TIGR02391 family protein [Palleronia sp. LCG004]WOI57494.1 TIGR02391 family protein [Palleronia sp. LCG004]